MAHRANRVGRRRAAFLILVGAKRQGAASPPEHERSVPRGPGGKIAGDAPAGDWLKIGRVPTNPPPNNVPPAERGSGGLFGVERVGRVKWTIATTTANSAAAFLDRPR